MRTVDMDEAKTHLSSLVDAAAKGNPFIITRAGKPRASWTLAESASSTALVLSGNGSDDACFRPCERAGRSPVRDCVRRGG